LIHLDTSFLIRALVPIREGSALRLSAQSPNIVTIYDIGQSLHNSFLIRDPACLGHEVDDDLVRDADNAVPADVVVCEQSDGVVRKRSESLLQPPNVLFGRIDEKIDVLGRSNQPVQDDGKAADQQISDSFVIQGPADGDEVFELRRA
jgi:hypothetical protein